MQQSREEAPAPAPGGVGGAHIALAVALSLIGAAAIHLVLEIVVPPRIPRAERVVVPELRGLDVGAARAVADSAGLLVHVDSDLPAGRVEGGRIVGQSPLAGSLVRLDDPVRVVVGNASTGALRPPEPPPEAARAEPEPAAPKTVEVPGLAGSPEADARSKLEDKGLEVGEVSHEASDRPEGEVLSQSVEARVRVEAGTAIDMVVSAGNPKVEVLSVVGMAADEAAKKLEAAGLTLGEVTEEPSDGPEGAVLKQKPGAGEEVERGAAVDLVVAAPPKEVQLPSVYGKRGSEAKEMLEDLGLKVRTREVFHDTLDTGYAIRTRPKTGEKVEPGSSVDLYLVE